MVLVVVVVVVDVVSTLHVAVTVLVGGMRGSEYNWCGGRGRSVGKRIYILRSPHGRPYWVVVVVDAEGREQQQQR